MSDNAFRLRLPTKTIGHTLEDPEARQQLRAELDPHVEAINQRIASGWTVERLEYTIFPDGDGLSIVVVMEPPAGWGGNAESGR